MPDSNSHTRRQFVKFAATGIATAPWLIRTAYAQDKVEESEPTAQALAYVHDASQSERRTDASQTCANCQLYTGAEGDEWGPCGIFQNRAVSAKGWCSAWVLKTG